MVVKNQQGIAALLIIVIVAAATLIMAYSASLLGLGELEMGYVSQKGQESLSVADGCLEETLWRIRLDQNYGLSIGEINLSVSNGSCIINVADLGNNQRRITVLGKVGDYNKNIEAEITLAGNVISIDSWQEKEN